MKNLSIFLLGACLLFGAGHISAQQVQRKAPVPNEPDYNKPRLFADLPDKIDFNPADLAGLFTYDVGQNVSISISREFDFSGQVVSKSDASAAATVVIRSTNRLGARLVLTRVTDTDGSVRYLGRIISMQHGDSYEITSDKNQYYFKKKGIYELMNE